MKLNNLAVKFLSIAPSVRLRASMTFILLFLMMFNSQAQVTWEVQSDYFGERNAVAQTRTIRSMALSKDGSAVYTGNIQSPNVGSNAIRKVSSATLAVGGTDHVIFGNGMPGGSGAFGPVGGQPVYAGGATGTFLAWTATGNSPRGLATDDRGYVYAALSSGISSANQVIILSSDLSTQVGFVSISGPTGVSVLKSGGTYYLYIAADTQLRRYDVTNPASPVLDAGWTNSISSGAFGLTVDSDGTVFLVGDDLVRRIDASGALTHTVSLASGGDVAVLYDKIYVVRRGSPAQPVSVFNKADLSSGGADLVVPELGAFTRGTLSQFTAIDVSADGRIWISEENYTAGGNGIPSYTPPVTSFNPTPGAITGRIYFDRVLVSSPIEAPCDVAIGEVISNPETCPGAEDGSITITATTSFGPLTYSISGPVTANNSTGVFTDLPDGSYTITVSDDGLAGCMTTSSTMVEAGIDNTSPSISCFDQTVTFSGEFSTISLDVNDLATASDNCGNTELMLSQSSVSCEEVGTTVPVTVSVSDGNGNDNSCISNITVEGLPCGFTDDPDGINCDGGSSASYDAETETFTLESDACYSSNFAADNASFAKFELCGDGEIIARVASITPALGWAGVMMRESSAAGAKKVALATTLGNTVRREIRTMTNGYAIPQQFFSPGASWVKLSRTGNQFIGSISPNGVTWQIVLFATVSMTECIEAGLYLTNFNATLVTATFDNVSINVNESRILNQPEVNIQQQTAADLVTPEFSIYPNPVSSELQVDLQNYAGQQLSVDIFDALGQQLLSRQLDRLESNLLEFDLAEWKSGTYFLRVSGEHGNKVRPFVITR